MILYYSKPLLNKELLSGENNGKMTALANHCIL